MKKKTTEKRLFQYALQFKKKIIIGIIFLMIATALELAGPLIAKTIIDEHVVGVEGTWYELSENDDRNTVEFNNRYYKRADRVEENDGIIGTRTLLQIGDRKSVV